MSGGARQEVEVCHGSAFRGASRVQIVWVEGVLADLGNVFG